MAALWGHNAAISRIEIATSQDIGAPAQMLIAGGSGEYCANALTPAGNKSWYFDVTPGANHSLHEEKLAFPRIVSPLARATCQTPNFWRLLSLKQ